MGSTDADIEELENATYKYLIGEQTEKMWQRLKGMKGQVSHEYQQNTAYQVAVRLSTSHVLRLNKQVTLPLFYVHSSQVSYVTEAFCEIKNENTTVNISSLQHDLLIPLMGVGK
ncbi:calcium/calmodulin-dependent 3',5'-cyclic nucleotide phosphodiesterase 1A-like protein [Cricetulus griseus]|nr:calcium/calmodulin-dependent 3',5'-cyclic nucleotide phosphodiesterase 1A-like protein [Cricetulus griseus]